MRPFLLIFCLFTFTTATGAEPQVWRPSILQQETKEQVSTDKKVLPELNDVEFRGVKADIAQRSLQLDYDASQVLRHITDIWRSPNTNINMSMVSGAGEGGFRFLGSPSAVTGTLAKIIIFDMASNSFLYFNPATEQITEDFTLSQNFENPIEGIYQGSDFHLFVTDSFSASVREFDFNGNLLKTYSDSRNLQYPVASLVNPLTNEVIVGDQLYDRFVVFDRSGNLVRAVGSRGTTPGKFNTIVDMAEGPDGIYVLDKQTAHINVYGFDYTFKYAIVRNEVTIPCCLAVDAAGRVYVGDIFDNTIKIYDRNGVIGSFGSAGIGYEKFNSIDDLWYTQSHLFVADRMNGRIGVLLIAPEASYWVDDPWEDNNEQSEAQSSETEDK